MARRVVQRRADVRWICLVAPFVPLAAAVRRSTSPVSGAPGSGRAQSRERTGRPKTRKRRGRPFGRRLFRRPAPRRGPAARTAEPARAPGHRPAPVTASPGGRLGRAGSCRGRGFPQAVEAIATCERLLAEFEAEAYAVEVHPTEDDLARVAWRVRLRTLGSP